VEECWWRPVLTSREDCWGLWFIVIRSLVSLSQDHGGEWPGLVFSMIYVNKVTRGASQAKQVKREARTKWHLTEGLIAKRPFVRNWIIVPWLEWSFGTIEEFGRESSARSIEEFGWERREPFSSQFNIVGLQNLFRILMHRRTVWRAILFLLSASISVHQHLRAVVLYTILKRKSYALAMYEPAT